jgi:sugar/nucleoside kinase (ribokinase family)
VGLARLGHPVTFLGTWGEDDDGRLLEQSLSAEGDDVHECLTDDCQHGATVAVGHAAAAWCTG